MSEEAHGSEGLALLEKGGGESLSDEHGSEKGGTLSRLLGHASARRKWLFLLFMVCQGSFVLTYYWQANVRLLPPAVIGGMCVCLLALLVVGGVLVGTAPQSKVVLLCVLACAFVWLLLFTAWLQLFISSAIFEVLALPSTPGLQERVLSGFVVLLVFSSDVFAALDHLNGIRPSWRMMLPVLVIAGALLGVTVTQRFFPEADSLPFELALTACIVLLHLQASLVAHHGPALGLIIAVGVSLVTLAGLCAAVCLYVLEHEAIADVMHRCVDVILLLESHLARVATFKT
jgi:hypothetical protein